MNSEYKEIQSYNFGVTRSVSRTGSYYSDYYYDYYKYEVFEIKDIVIPEKFIPAHVENKWIKINYEN